MGNKYLLCRPQGGLNDLLCQIELCCRYGEATGRVVVVDTACANTGSFHDEFNHCFHSRQSRLLLSRQDVPVDVTSLRVFPHGLQGRLDTYAVDPKMPNQPYVDSLTKQAVTFDFNALYDEELLVHHQPGGGDQSLFALLRLRLTDALKQALEQRLSRIGGPYVGLHVRHTDYQSDYREVLASLAKAAPPKLFVATDNQHVLDEVRQTLTSTQVFSFAEGLSTDGQPIHKATLQGSPEQAFSRNQDAILDLLMLALAARLVLVKISSRQSAGSCPAYSGFSVLANNLKTAKVVLHHLLEPTSIRFGLA